MPQSYIFVRCAKLGKNEYIRDALLNDPFASPSEATERNDPFASPLCVIICDGDGVSWGDGGCVAFEPFHLWTNWTNSKTIKTFFIAHVCLT